MSFQNRFSEAELARIRAAVKEAESKISGEIVPVFVEKSGHYTIANYRGVIVGAFIFFVMIILGDRFIPSWKVNDPLFYLMIVLLGGLAGGLIAHFINPVKRMLISQSHKDAATKQRAENAFLEEEVFNTRHRTGIMIFISFFENEVMVMADRGISKVVEQQEWNKMVTGIVDQIKKGKVIDGMEAAIRRSGEILIEKGFHRTPDDINELRDDLRIEE